MTSWVEEGALADMKHRLDKLRVDQSRHKSEDEPAKKDTLKILQSKFGSPVYDPTSPMQKAYDRRCARSGRRKSIEFEDLYLKKGSGLLQLPNSFGGPKTRSGSATPKKHPLVRSSSGMDYSSQLSQLQGSAGSNASSRMRKSSDPSSHYRKGGGGGGGEHSLHSKSSRSAMPEHAGGQKGGQGEGEGHKGQGQRGILHMTVTEEEKKAIDRKLAGMDCVAEEGGSQHHVTPRKKKISRSGPRP